MPTRGKHDQIELRAKLFCAVHQNQCCACIGAAWCLHLSFNCWANPNTTARHVCVDRSRTSPGPSRPLSHARIRPLPGAAICPRCNTTVPQRHSPQRYHASVQTLSYTTGEAHTSLFYSDNDPDMCARPQRRLTDSLEHL